MKIYHYDSITGEFLNQSIATLDPIDDNPLIPANATKLIPPPAISNKVAVFNGSVWSLIDDYRGYIGYDVSGVKQKIDVLGVVPDVLWTVTKPFILSDAKNSKKSEIRSAFNIASTLAVADVSSISWDGGYDSALKLDAAKRMAQMALQTSVVFYNSSNTAHTLTLSEADAIILLLGADYQTKFSNKQNLMTQVDALPSTATQADLDTIIIAF